VSLISDRGRMALVDSILELLEELVGEAVAAIVIDGVTGFLPAITIAHLLIAKGFLDDKGDGKPSKQQVSQVRSILKHYPDRFEPRCKGRITYFRLRD